MKFVIATHHATDKDKQSAIWSWWSLPVVGGNVATLIVRHLSVADWWTGLIAAYARLIHPDVIKLDYFCIYAPINKLLSVSEREV